MTNSLRSYAPVAEREKPRPGLGNTERYIGLLRLSDAAVVIFSTMFARVVWFGTGESPVDGSSIDYYYFALLLILVWILMLAVQGTRSPRVVGFGTDEYRRTLDATFRLFATVALIALVFQWDISRGFLLVALSAGLFLLFTSRWLWRRWLWRQRRSGRMNTLTLVVGDVSSCARILRELSSQPRAGYDVVGVCIPHGDTTLAQDLGVPVFSGVDEIEVALTGTGASTVLVSNESALSTEEVRQLSWRLEVGRQHLVVVPSLTDIGGPRIHTRPVAGLPLIHVETPRFEGTSLVIKRAIDIIGSSLLILLLSPVLATIALMVKLTSQGPVFFTQERLGLQGKPFHMIKFRSMHIDAEERLEELRKERGDGFGNEIMFKMKDDPRITTIGAVLRRYSLDEIPQLFNVLFGTMSLVGPRPSLSREAALYEPHVHRRFLVKPGMSGLWQVSGRSSLSWEDTVRLDLYYVENWSLLGDVMILLRTFKAVFSPGSTAG